MKNHEQFLRCVIGLLPSVVLLVMISTCVFADIAVSKKPQFIISVIPISLITIVFTAVSIPRKTEGGKDT